MNWKIGFVGTGFMGTALLKGVVKSGLISPDKISIYDIDREKAHKISAETGARLSASSEEVVRTSEAVVLAVKPAQVKAVLEPLTPVFDGKLLISIAVGIPTGVYSGILGEHSRIIRSMPNTPAAVGEGITLLCGGGSATEEDVHRAKALFETVGKAEIFDERLMNEVTALTSSSPAYIFMFIEAMADAAVLSGIPRQVAYRLAAQAVLGAAKMVLETGKHPAELKDQVCSPAGTTIEAVRSLEKNGLRYTVIQAMDECTHKAREIGKMAEGTES